MQVNLMMPRLLCGICGTSFVSFLCNGFAETMGIGVPVAKL